jgi:hypothetical protein
MDPKLRSVLRKAALLFVIAAILVGGAELGDQWMQDHTSYTVNDLK